MNKLPERIRIKDIARLADVSVGTVDRVIHGRSGVSEASKKRVEEILKQLDYQPNMYASALASNKKYTFICLLPQHLEGEYWTAVELGIHEAIATYSDFNTSVKINYYDPYDYHSFVDASEAILTQQPELQGLNGIKALCDHLIFKKDVTCINYMPIDLLTVETIDYYHSK